MFHIGGHLRNKKVGSLLTLLLIISALLVSLIMPLITASNVNAASLTKEQCQSIGGTWQAGDASNRGVARCTGQAACAIDGGIWDPTRNSCNSTPYRSDNSRSASQSVKDRATSYAYYKALSYCLAEYLQSEISANIDTNGEDTSPADGLWYGTGPDNPDKQPTMTIINWDVAWKYAEVVFMGEEDASCTRLTTEALDFWDIGSPADLLKRIGYTYNGEKERWQAPNDGKKVSALKSWVETAGNNTSYTTDVKNYLTKRAFDTFCRPNRLGKFNDLSSARQTQINNYDRRSGSVPAKAKISEVNEAGTALVAYGYEYYFGPEQGAGFMESVYPIFEGGENAYDNPDAYQTCNTMVDNINSTAWAAVHATLQASCINALSTGESSAALAACAAGMQFKDVENFCDIAFPSDQPLNRKCKAGQGALVVESPSVDANITEDETSNTGTTCAVESIGWLVCPVLTFLSDVADSIYGIVSSWLRVDVALFQTESSTHNGWRAIRDIANFGFVIVFLIVIFSQLTGTGISNYGVKKILPRLIIIAVVINISFYITQLLVDISNILGSSLRDLFANLAVFDDDKTRFWDRGTTFTELTNGVLAGTVGVLGIGAGVAITVYGGIGLLMIILLAALLAVAITMIILAARMALIVIFIVISPLAFLAVVLPNTKRLYDSWQKIFISLLVIYPMIAIVFGASEMAANIIVQQNGILGLAVATIPLFAVIPMLKGSLNAVPIAGALASRLAKSSPLRGQIKSGLKRTGSNLGNDVRARALAGEDGNRTRRFVRWAAGGRARGAARDRRFTSEAARADAIYNANNALNNGGSLSERASAVAALDRIQEEEVSNIMALDARENDGNGVAVEALMGRLTSNTASVAEKLAAVRQIEQRGGMAARLKMAQLAPQLQGEQNAEVRRAITSSTAGMGDANPSYGGQSLAEIQAGSFEANSAHVRYANDPAFNARRLLEMHPVAQREFLSAIENAGDTPDAKRAREALAAAYEQIQGNSDLAARTNKEFDNRVNAALGRQQANQQTGELAIDHGENQPPASPPQSPGPPTPTA